MKFDSKDPKLKGVVVGDRGTVVSRAYSVLQVKDVSEGPKVVTITGMATTPSADRMGDVVSPLGAKFKTPMPLLWQHQSDQPVGLVTFAKPNKNGIPFTAELPIVQEPGRLKDRIDEAIQSVKLGLVAAVSIGFQALQDGVEWIEETNALLFKEWEWLELSLVTIPANSDATIATVKSIDRLLMPSPSGQKASTTVSRVQAQPPAGGTVIHVAKSGTSGLPAGEFKMNIAEQIKQAQAARAAKSAERKGMMTKAAEAGVSLTADEATAYEALSVEIKGLDDHLKRLEDLRVEELETAVVVDDANTTQRAAAARDAKKSHPHVLTLAGPQLEPGMAFARYVLAEAKSFKLKVPLEQMVKQLYPDMAKMHNFVRDAAQYGGVKNLVRMKAAVPAGAVDVNGNWGHALQAYNDYAGDFVSYLRPQTIVGKFGTVDPRSGQTIPALRATPFNVHIKGQSSGGSGYWVGEGQPKPVTKFDFNDVYLGWFKVAGICVVTEEMMRFGLPNAEGLVRDALRDAIVERLDLSFVDPAFAGGVASPESITHGVQPITPTGTTATALRHDLDALWAAWDSTNIDGSQAVYIMDATTARKISSMRTTLESNSEFPQMTNRGGSIGGIPVIVSNYVGRTSAGGTIILVAANEIFYADDGEVTIDSSNEASIQMDSAPTNASSPNVVTSTMVSMWQTDSVAMRAERFANWKKRRNVAVQYIAGAQYA